MFGLSKEAPTDPVSTEEVKDPVEAPVENQGLDTAGQPDPVGEGTPNPEPAQEVPAVLPSLEIVYPTFEGKQVIEVLGFGHKPELNLTHVKFDDGTTGHVPTELLKQ